MADSIDGPQPQQAAPGWYPVDNVSQRYWDGEVWSDSIAPLPAPLPSHQVGFSSDDKTYALLLHLSPFVAPVIGPLVMWLIKREHSQFIDHHGKEALNFGITMMIAFVVSIVLMFVLIGFLLIFALVIVGIVFPILAAVAANRGEYYRYPAILRLVT